MIWLFEPFLPKEAGREVKKVIDSGFINRGKKAKEFERLLREKFGFPMVHTVNSCTSALRLALLAAGVQRGDEVISTPWTMIATNTAILEVGAKPVFVDINYEDFNIDVTKIEKAITSRTRAIMVVHYAGYPVDMEEVERIGCQYDLEVIQDCAHALGSTYRGRHIGSFGRYNCFSFQAIKIMTTGDGGAVTTDKPEVYEDVVKRSWFGIDKAKRVKTDWGAYPTDVDVLGYKNNNTDIDAALGIVGLRHLDEALKRRKRVADIYNRKLRNLERISLPVYKGDRETAYWLYPIHVDDRVSFAEAMVKAGIQVDKHNERNDKYSIFGGLRNNLPNTARVDQDICHLPIHASLKIKDVRYVVKKVKEWDRTY